MREVEGDIWEWYDSGDWMLVPIRYGVCRDDSNFSGNRFSRGLSSRFPEVNKKLQRIYPHMRSVTDFCCYMRRKVILFPIRPVPELEGWAQEKKISNPKLIEQRFSELAVRFERWYEAAAGGGPFILTIPAFGIKDELTTEQMVEMTKKHLPGKTYLLVRPPSTPG